MARFTSFINEKVNKQEIDTVLTSTDILVGAEFEFKIGEHMFDHLKEKYNDLVDEYNKYNKDLKVWIDVKGAWRKAYNNILEKFKEQSSNRKEYNKLVDDWLKENPEPIRPEHPENDLVRSYKDYIDFDELSSILVDHMRSDSVLNQYIRGEWDIHEDSSLNGYGIELVSPPMTIKEFLVACPKIFEMIDNIGYTDNECGLHIGVSLTGSMDIDPVKLALFTDENYIWKKFDGRELNTYVEHMQDKIKKELVGNTLGLKKTTDVKIEKLKKMIRESDIDIKYLSSHYHGVNIEHLDDDEPYIEFRYMGGNDYHRKWTDVRNVIAHYIYNLKLSSDPNFKKNEYLLKCTRILNKLETWAILTELEKEEEDIRYSAFDPDINAVSKRKKQEIHIKNLKKRLQFLPKLTKDEMTFMKYVGA